MGAVRDNVTAFVCFISLLALSQSCDNPTNCKEDEECRGSCYTNRNSEQYCYGQCLPARNTTAAPACEDEYSKCASWMDRCSNSVVAKFCKKSCNACNTDADCRGFICDGVCVPLTYLCDGVRDCRDGNDERNCNYLQELWYGSNGKRKCGIRTTRDSTVATQASFSVNHNSFRKALRRQHRTRSKRLVNSKYSAAYSWPWTGIILSDTQDSVSVPLEPRTQTFCGATLIHEDWAITAAHCVTTDGTVQSAEFVITFGKHYTRTADSERVSNQVRNASKILYFKDYDDTDIYNDLALLKLNESVVLNDYVNIVCMPRSSDIDQFYKTGGVTTGWGFDDTGKISHRLKQALVRPMERLRCRNQIYGYPDDHLPFLGPSIDASLLCTEIDREGGFGVICDGDSGGPMVVRRGTGSYAMMGIASFGTDQDCSKPGEAAVFTSVYYFLPWISHFVDVTS